MRHSINRLLAIIVIICFFMPSAYAETMLFGIPSPWAFGEYVNDKTQIDDFFAFVETISIAEDDSNPNHLVVIEATRNYIQKNASFASYMNMYDAYSEISEDASKLTTRIKQGLANVYDNQKDLLLMTVKLFSGRDYIEQYRFNNYKSAITNVLHRMSNENASSEVALQQMKNERINKLTTLGISLGSTALIDLYKGLIRTVIRSDYDNAYYSAEWLCKKAGLTGKKAQQFIEDYNAASDAAKAEYEHLQSLMTSVADSVDEFCNKVSSPDEMKEFAANIFTLFDGNSEDREILVTLADLFSDVIGNGRLDEMFVSALQEVIDDYDNRFISVLKGLVESSISVVNTAAVNGAILALSNFLYKEMSISVNSMSITGMLTVASLSMEIANQLLYPDADKQKLIAFYAMIDYAILSEEFIYQFENDAKSGKDLSYDDAVKYLIILEYILNERIMQYENLCAIAQEKGERAFWWFEKESLEAKLNSYKSCIQVLNIKVNEIRTIRRTKSLAIDVATQQMRNSNAANGNLVWLMEEGAILHETRVTYDDFLLKSDDSYEYINDAPTYRLSAEIVSSEVRKIEESK